MYQKVESNAAEWPTSEYRNRLHARAEVGGSKFPPQCDALPPPPAPSPSVPSVATVWMWVVTCAGHHPHPHHSAQAETGACDSHGTAKRAAHPTLHTVSWNTRRKERASGKRVRGGFKLLLQACLPPLTCCLSHAGVRCLRRHAHRASSAKPTFSCLVSDFFGCAIELFSKVVVEVC